MQDDLTRLDVVPEASLFDQSRCMTGQLFVVHFPAADLAAIDVQDHVQAQELATHSDRKIGDVPGPGLIGPGGGNRQRLAHRTRRLSPTAPVHLVVLAQDAIETGFGSNVDSRTGQARNNLTWRQAGIFRLVGPFHNMRLLFLAQRMWTGLVGPSGRQGIILTLGVSLIQGCQMWWTSGTSVPVRFARCKPDGLCHIFSITCPFRTSYGFGPIQSIGKGRNGGPSRT